MNRNEINIVQYPSVMYVLCEAFMLKDMQSILHIPCRANRQMMEVRQVLVWYLLKENISFAGISALAGVKRSMIYYNSRMVDDRIYVGDVSTIEMIDKINRAKEAWLKERELRVDNYELGITSYHI